MTEELKPGDKVELTGADWPHYTDKKFAVIRPREEWGEYTTIDDGDDMRWSIYKLPGNDCSVTKVPTGLDQVREGTNKILEDQDKNASVNPSHYDFPGGVQVIDITKHLDFLTGNVVKYVCRAGRKEDRLTDLRKAEKYLAWAIEKEKNDER